MLPPMEQPYSIQYLFLDQFSIQCPYPFLAEAGAAEQGVEVLLREEELLLIICFVDNVVFVQEDDGFHRDAFRRKFA